MKVNYNTMQLTFGQKLKMLRQMTGRSETETAFLLKKTAESYLKYEDDFLYPTESMLRKVAKLYHITYQELLAYGE
jgi:transcriptional regulator with XRE-family HTH domain